jgi:protein arginine kinase activator
MLPEDIYDLFSFTNNSLNGKNMYCERCKQIEATIHLSEVIKDMKSEVHLCESCAREVGLNTKISNFSLSLPEMLTFLNVDEVSDYKDGRHCATCGSDFLEYKRDGNLGCPECYNNLSEYLDPVLAGFHGEKRHIGKFPVYNDEAGFTEKIFNPVKIEVISSADLQYQLDSAVNEERYEDAAVLRDKIREINLSLK